MTVRSDSDEDQHDHDPFYTPLLDTEQKAFLSGDRTAEEFLDSAFASARERALADLRAEQGGPGDLDRRARALLRQQLLLDLRRRAESQDSSRLLALAASSDEEERLVAFKSRLWRVRAGVTLAVALTFFLLLAYLLIVGPEDSIFALSALAVSIATTAVSATSWLSEVRFYKRLSADTGSRPATGHGIPTPRRQK